MLRLTTSSDTNDTDDELADEHAKSTVDQDWATAILLNDVEGERGRANVDDGGNDLGQEGIVDGAELLEESGTEVEDEVDTSPLLHHLERSTQDGSAEIGAGVEKSTLEAVEPGAEVTILWDDGHFVLVVGNNLSEFLLDVVGSLGLATETGQDLSSLLEVALLYEVTWGLWEEDKSNTEDQGPEHLERNRNAVSTSVQSLLGAVVDARSEKETDGDAELIAGDQSTTNLSGADLRHVQNDDGRDETDTETSDETTGDNETETLDSSLEDNTDEEDTAAQDDGGSATNPVSEVTSDQSTEEGTGRENGGDEGLLPVGKGVGGELGGIGGDRSALHEVDEGLHAQDTGDVSGVITKVDTTKGGKGTHQVGLEGDGSFDTLHISGSVQSGNCTARHDEGVCRIDCCSGGGIKKTKLIELRREKPLLAAAASPWLRGELRREQVQKEEEKRRDGAFEDLYLFCTQGTLRIGSKTRSP